MVGLNSCIHNSSLALYFFVSQNYSNPVCVSWDFKEAGTYTVLYTTHLAGSERKVGMAGNKASV